MSQITQLTDEQYKAFQRGESITITPPKPEIKFPVLRKNKYSSLVVLFTDKTTGTVVVPTSLYNAGEHSTEWSSCKNNCWEDVPVHNNLVHKQLVWCWNRDKTHERCLRFYDAIHKKCTFNFRGDSYGAVFEYYEPFTGPWPEWAIKALQTLQD